MKKSTHLMIVLLGAMILLSACGEEAGKESGRNTDEQIDKTRNPTRAVLTLTVSGPAGVRIGGLDATVNLPEGATVKSSTNPPEPDAGVVVASGQAGADSLVSAKYTEASAQAQASVRLMLVNGGQNGFGPGEFATLISDIAPGTTPAAADFTIREASVRDVNGVEIAGAAVSVGVELLGGSGTKPLPPRAIVKLFTNGQADRIGGIDATISLPAGVTVKSTAAPPATDIGVVAASGPAAANSLVTAAYTPASGAQPATVRLVLVSSGQNGFGPGEFATIHCDLASGAHPSATDFTVTSATVDDLNGALIQGLTVTVGMEFE